MSKKRVFLTGATGLMGWQGLGEFLKYPEKYEITLLARKSDKNLKKLAPVADKVRIVWGDLLNYGDVLKGVTGAEYVLHVGGMVSPSADYYPEKTLKTNVLAAENIVKAVLEQHDSDKIKVVYIGTVAQTSDRRIPMHWGRTGDPQSVSAFDCYGLSKIRAERIICDSGLKHWVSLRQSGVLYPGILKNFDPIMFHVPLHGVLEWATIEDSGILLEHVCRDDVPDTFWNNFYNISSGPQYRMTNYEFEKRVLGAVSCPPPEKIFDSNWFALKNFHGQFFLDSDKLEDTLHFRCNVPVDEYFDDMRRKLPKFFKLAKIVPSSIIKLALKNLANRKEYGTQYWIKHNCEDKIKAFYGSMDAYKSIPDWPEFDLSEPPGEEKALVLNHGYDETKSLDQLTYDDLQNAALFRGGELISNDYNGNPTEKLHWRCGYGHDFHLSPEVMLKGGHWCDECLDAQVKNKDIAEKSKFLSQIYNR